MTYPLIAGRFVRRPVRRFLQAHGFDYTEDKGLLDSLFTVRGPADKMGLLHRQVRHWEDSE